MESRLNLPNTLTIIRILLSPVFLYFLLVDKIALALLIFLFVAVTDLADGWIARKTDQKTKFGEAIDPMADKFMVFLALIGIILKFDFPLWALPFFISRDIVSLAGSVLIHIKRKGVWSANRLGKLTTFLQIVCILFFILQLPLRTVVLWITLASSMAAAVIYGVRWVKILRNKHLQTEQH